MTTPKLLDVGCGDGQAAIDRGWHQDYEYVGLDIDAANVTAARNDGLDVRRVDVTTGLPFERNQFGVVVCKAILEHLLEPVAVLRDCYRVLEPAGCLLVVVPSDRSYDLWGDSTHVRGYRRDALANDLAAAGFMIDDIRWRLGWSSPGMAVRSIVRGIVPWTPYGWPRAWTAIARKGGRAAADGGRGQIPEAPRL